MPKKRQQKKGGAQGKRGKGKGGAGPAGAVDLAGAKAAFLSALQRMFEEEEGGDDSYETLDDAGGAECVAEMALEEVTSAVEEGGADAGCGLWAIAPDSAETIRDAGGSDEVLATLEEGMAEALGALLTALTAPRLEVGAEVQAVFPTDGELHPARVVEMQDEAAGATTLRVCFTEYGVEEDDEVSQIVLPEVVSTGAGAAGCNGTLGVCALCEREMPISLHHLVPLTLHARIKKKGGTDQTDLDRTVALCRPCHSAVHKAEDDATLAESYNTLDALRGHPEIARFAEWASKEKTTEGAVSGAGYRQ